MMYNRAIGSCEKGFVTIPDDSNAHYNSGVAGGESGKVVSSLATVTERQNNLVPVMGVVLTIILQRFLQSVF